jgi:hypothetical protein
MATGNSLYQRKSGRRAREKKKFRSLVRKLEELAAEEGYTKKQIATERVSLTAVYQWSTGYTLTAKPEQTIEKLKNFLVASQAD